MKKRYRTIMFDKLQLYFSEPLVIDVEGAQGTITLYQPTIGDIIHIGERKFMDTLNIFVSNTTVYRCFLWDLGIDWNVCTDFELFTMLYKATDKDVCEMFFKDISLHSFEVFEKHNGDKKEVVLYSEEHGIEINEEVYQYIHQYFQTVFNMFPEEKITTDSILKQWYIDKDRRQQEIDREKAKHKNNENSSHLLALVSSCVNHSGFKYKTKELREVGVFEFYDSCKRLQVYEQTTAVLKGMYSGFVDGSKFKESDYNFMKEL